MSKQPLKVDTSQISSVIHAILSRGPAKMKPDLKAFLGALVDEYEPPSTHEGNDSPLLPEDFSLAHQVRQKTAALISQIRDKKRICASVLLSKTHTMLLPSAKNNLRIQGNNHFSEFAVAGRGFSFGDARRELSSVNKNNPGPACYDAKNSSISCSTGKTFAREKTPGLRYTHSKDAKPGPAEYFPSRHFTSK